MCPQAGHDRRWRSSPRPPEAQRRPAVRAEVQRLGHPARHAATRVEVGRIGRRDRARTRRHPPCQASRTAIDAATRAARPTRLTATQASRNRPFPRSTGIHAQAERQIRTIASAVVRTRSGAAMSDAQLDQRVAEPRAELERRDGDRAADEDHDRQVDVVLLQRRRGDLRDRSRRQALEARRQASSAGRGPAARAPPGDPARACPGSQRSSSMRHAGECSPTAAAGRR